MNWLLFGSNGLTTVANDWSVIRRFVKSEKSLNRMGKTIVNFNMMKNDFLMHCHNIRTNDKFKVKDVFGNEIDGEANTNQFDRSNLDVAYLAHYRTKSKQEFFEKVRRNIDGYGDRDWTIHIKDFDKFNINSRDNLDLWNFYFSNEVKL